MTLGAPALAERYRDALCGFLAAADEAGLQEAYELGRAALGEGHGLSEWTVVHERTVAAVLAGTLPASAEMVVAHAAAFFAESLMPFEMAQRGFRETNTRLQELNRTLEERVAARTAELLAKGEEIEAMSRQLWQAAKLATMGELAAGIAHELNNPLATITVRVESLLDQCEDGDPQRRSLGIIEGELDRMRNLIANLLQFSRAEQATRSTLDVREELDNTLELIHYHLRNHRIEGSQDYAVELPLLHADRQQLRQLFLNLITNASDAMPKGGTLTLRAHPRDGGRRVVIEVEDTGRRDRPGAPGQGDRAVLHHQAAGQGDRPGLYLPPRVVAEHGGTLDIASELGRGTRFSIALPTAAEGNGADPDDSGED